MSTPPASGEWVNVQVDWERTTSMYRLFLWVETSSEVLDLTSLHPSFLQPSHREAAALGRWTHEARVMLANAESCAQLLNKMRLSSDAKVGAELDLWTRSKNADMDVRAYLPDCTLTAFRMIGDQGLRRYTLALEIDHIPEAVATLKESFGKTMIEGAVEQRERVPDPDGCTLV